MRKIGATKLYDPQRLAIVLDHVAPAKTEKYAQDQQTSRNFAREFGITKFYDVDAGIAHLVLIENGHVKPGDLIVGDRFVPARYMALWVHWARASVTRKSLRCG